MGESWDIPNRDSESGKSKDQTNKQKNPEEKPHISDLTCHKDET